MFKKLIIATVALSSMATFAAVTKIEVDPAASKLVYVGKKVTGEHTGEVKIANGHLNFDKDALKGGEFEIDMTTITNTDLTDKEYLTKFLTHITSDDFFATDKFKTAKLVIKSVKKEKAADTYKVTADLTIKGKTAPVTFDAVATKEKASAKVVFDRTKYDIKYGSGKFFQGLGDKLINDDVQLDVSLTAKK
ncbi:MAG: YceI family protein [Bacteriovorax sp.]|nr:YceI family protein [Bacteriovorax sp.]